MIHIPLKPEKKVTVFKVNFFGIGMSIPAKSFMTFPAPHVNAF